MPKRFLSRSARAERPSPCPLSQMICARVQPAGWPYSSWHSSAASTISTVMYGGSPSSEAFEAASLQNPKTALAIWETASAARTKHSTPDRIPARGPAAAAAAAAALPLLPSLRRGRRRPCGAPSRPPGVPPAAFRAGGAPLSPRLGRDAGLALPRPGSLSPLLRFGRRRSRGRGPPRAPCRPPSTRPSRPGRRPAPLRARRSPPPPFRRLRRSLSSGTRPPSERGRADVPLPCGRPPAARFRPAPARAAASALRPKATRAGVTFRGPCWPPCPRAPGRRTSPRLTPGLRSPRRSCRTMRFLRRRPLRP